jgi:hypothetical protein
VKRCGWYAVRSPMADQVDLRMIMFVLVGELRPCQMEGRRKPFRRPEGCAVRLPWSECGFNLHFNQHFLRSISACCVGTRRIQQTISAFGECRTRRSAWELSPTSCVRGLNRVSLLGMVRFCPFVNGGVLVGRHGAGILEQAHPLATLDDPAPRIAVWPS